MRGAGFVLAALAALSCACAERVGATRGVSPETPPPAPRPDGRPASVPDSRPSSAAAAAAPPEVRAFLKGQTHVHTSGSYDAKAEPASVLSYYSERGYDFVAITDHNRITTLEAPAGVLLVPGVELTQNAEVCQPPPPRGYRCLFHTSALFVDPSRDMHRGERFTPPFRLERLAAYSSQMEAAAALGGVSVVNHPHFHFSADANTIVSLIGRGLRLFELVNAALDPQNPAGRAASERRSERLWDEVLSRGVLLYGLATDDAHHFPGDGNDRAGKSVYAGDRAWVMVRAEKKLDAIREALLAGQFYATTGVMLDALEMSTARIRVAVRSSAGKTYRTRFVGKGGAELSQVAGLEASYAPRGDEGYVRAVVEDSSGSKAWIQPLMLGTHAP
jgi:hypothetical protein